MKARIDSQAVEIGEELVARCDRPLPRYTSYPPAPAWGAMDGAGFAAALAQDRPSSLYVHIPFCASKCAFCGCSAIATTHRPIIERCVAACLREIALAAEAAGGRTALAQIHIGGGTPTSAGIGALGAVVAAIRRGFDIAPGAEIAIEIDPRATTAEDLAALAGMGFNRMSFGVQDFDPGVGRAIGRISDPAQVARLVAAARAAGVGGINLDLVYGLPGQTDASWNPTLDHALGIAPDRVALFNFAYLPKQLPHQRRIDPARLPGPMQKIALFVAAAETFGEAGYAFIGLDHFARAGDALAVAHREGKLTRNFQGYAAGGGAAIVGVGPTAISELGPVYAQNEKKLARYLPRIEAGAFATSRGVRLTPDDERRRRAIRQLMCAQRAPILDEDVRRKLGPLADDGLVVIAGDEVVVTPLGRLFVRHAAAAFDATLDPRCSPYSRAV